MTTTKNSSILVRMGFSDLEVAIYVFLLTDRPSTGYRISHAIGKPTANTYKAISALELKGAVLVDEGENRVCRAVPPGELLSRLEREFQSNRLQAQTELSALEKALPDQRIYHLKTVEQVLERARSMLGRAREIVLLDVFPGPLEILAENLRETAARGVRVVAKTYGDLQITNATGSVSDPIRDLDTSPLDLGAVQVVPTINAERVLRAWPGEQISVVVDATEHLLGLLAPSMTSVCQAVWSNSVFLSCIQHNHLASEVVLGHHLNVPAVPEDTRAKMSELDDISLLRARPRGLSALQNPTVLEEIS